MRTSARRCFTSGALCVFAAHLYILLHPRDKYLSLEEIDLVSQKAAPIHSVSHRKRLLAEGTELSETRSALSATKDDLPVISEQGFGFYPEHGPASILYLCLLSPWCFMCFSELPTVHPYTFTRGHFVGILGVTILRSL